jgi:Domain of unknown function (DUF4437)
MKLSKLQLALLIVFAVAWAVNLSGQKIIESRDRGKEFVGWVQPERLYWRPFTIAGMPDAEFKLLSFDESSKARSQITRLPAGWRHPKGYHNTNEEIFVLSGDLTVGGKRMTKYSYAYFPAGHAHGEAYTEYGVTLLHWWDGDPDFGVSRESKPGTRHDELVEDWNFYDKPWTKDEDFPKVYDFPTPPNRRLKLMRQDKVTGQMTWMNWSSSGGARAGYLPGKTWESHPSWEEAMLLEGDLTYGECLPQGEVVGTYTAGGYFFRPAGIKHGGRSAGSSSYSLYIFRSGKSLWADYFYECDSPTKREASTQKREGEK